MAITELESIALKARNAEVVRPLTGKALRRRAGDDSSRRGFVERRGNSSGKLGNRRTDNWMPYSTAFVAQLLGQQLDEQLKNQAKNQDNL